MMPESRLAMVTVVPRRQRMLGVKAAVLISTGTVFATRVSPLRVYTPQQLRMHFAVHALLAEHGAMTRVLDML